MSNRHNTSKRVFSIQTIIAKWSKQGQTSGSEFRQSLISCSHKAACQDKSLTHNSKTLPDLVPAVYSNSSQVELVLSSQSSRPFLEAGCVSSNAQIAPLQKELGVQSRTPFSESPFHSSFQHHPANPVSGSTSVEVVSVPLDSRPLASPSAHQLRSSVAAIQNGLSRQSGVDTSNRILDALSGPHSAIRQSSTSTSDNLVTLDPQTYRDPSLSRVRSDQVDRRTASTSCSEPSMMTIHEGVLNEVASLVGPRCQTITKWSLSGTIQRIRWNHLPRIQHRVGASLRLS